MAEAGLSTPLHLAASLLACFASAGLAIIVLTRPGALGVRTGSRPSDWILASGCLLFSVGHGLSGALLTAAASVVPWLHALGLALIALGLSRPRLRELTGPTVIVPVAAAPAATWLALGAAVVGAGRALAAGLAGIPIAVGLLAWGGAPWVREQSVTAAAALTLAGALAIGWWLWRASDRALRAKFVTASVTLLLAVVLLVATALSGLGSRDIVDAELLRLETLAATVADDLQNQWRVDAVNAAGVLRFQGEDVLERARNEQLGPLYDVFFQGQDQDFLVVLGEDGRVLGSFAPGGTLTNGFLLQVQGADFVPNLLSGEAPRAGSLLPIGGELVAVGGVPLYRSGAQPEDDPLGVVVTGRRADAAWAARARRQLGNNDILVSVGNRATVASQKIAPFAGQLARRLRGGETGAAVTAQGRSWYVGAATIEDPELGVVGRALAVSPAGVLAKTEESQARRLFLIALLGALLSGFAAGVVSGRLVAPIRRLTTVAAAVREGQLDVTANVHAGGEVGVLGRTFDEMTTSLSNQATQLRDAAGVQTRLRARLEALTSSMSDGLVAVNPDGKVVTFNPAAQRLVGRDITEVLGLPLDQVLVGRATGEQNPAEALGAYDSEETRAVQVLLERSDGGYTPTAVTAAPVHDIAGNTVLGRVFVLRDVTREVEVERMKTEFLSNVSHELRTPLTPIKGYAEVLARRDVGPEATRKFADQILDSTGRLERIVATIVDFAALDSGRLELRPEPVSLSELVDEMLAEWRTAYPGREFRRRVGKSLPAAYVDIVMLRRCLDELVSNAVKFSPEGGPIALAAVEVPGGGQAGAVRLSVKDRGVGIEPELAARIFSDFYQADASETRHYGGLGLGLALVRRIVEGMNGDIDLDSRPGEGSTFHLTLPNAAQSAE